MILYGKLSNGTINNTGILQNKESTTIVISSVYICFLIPKKYLFVFN